MFQVLFYFFGVIEHVLTYPNCPRVFTINVRRPSFLFRSNDTPLECVIIQSTSNDPDPGKRIIHILFVVTFYKYVVFYCQTRSDTSRHRL